MLCALYMLDMLGSLEVFQKSGAVNIASAAVWIYLTSEAINLR